MLVSRMRMRMIDETTRTDAALPPDDGPAAESAEAGETGRSREDRDAGLRAVQKALIEEIDASIGKLERARVG
jgi:hypothetical protein